MATDVVMPQMGESIAEGTIVRWIKKVGDKVDRDEPLFEISTDKVDAEIPSPAAGVVSEIRVKEGETVPVNSVVAVIGAAAAQAAPPSASAGVTSTSASADRSASAPQTNEGAAARQAPSGESEPHYHDRDEPASAASVGQSAGSAGKARSAAPSPETRPSPEARPEGRALAPSLAAAGLKAGPSMEDAIRERSSPLVRKIAKEHNVDISQINGT